MVSKEALIQKASEAAGRAYAPYSKFHVGAALLCDDGTIVTGANVENRSFGLTICAERSAVVRAISDGKRRFAAIAISCPDADYPVSPCGACRQVISEFLGPDVPVFFAGADGKVAATTVGALLPFDSLHELSRD